MTSRDEPFRAESVEEMVHQLLAQAPSHPSGQTEPDIRLVQDLRLVHADNTSSGEHVWARLAERLGERNVPLHSLHVLPHQSSRERKHAMSLPELNTIPSQRAEPPRGLRRGFALAAASLFVILLVGSAMWLFNAMRTLPQYTTTAQKGITSIHAGKLLCSTSYHTSAPLPVFVQPPLDWSARGAIATAYPFKTFSAQTCASQSLVNVPETSLAQPIWSPDGQHMLLLHGSVAEVRDAATGKVLVSFQATPAYEFAQAVWVADGTQIISSEVDVLSHIAESVNVRVWDVNSGALMRTALTFPNGILIGSAWISPNGQYLAVQRTDHTITFWSIRTGKVVSTTASSVAGNAQPVAWAPNGAALAIGLPDSNWPAQPARVQIWSSTTGHRLATFQDATTFEGEIGGLAWSPNGQYLAESSAQIHLWNVLTGKLVATFGQIPSGSEIVSVAWAPDSSKLASATTTYPTGPNSKLQKTLEVWQLS